MIEQKEIQELFGRLSVIYYQFKSQLHENTGKLWAKSLNDAGLEASDLNKAVKAIMAGDNRFKNFPPNSMQFVDLCKEMRIGKRISLDEAYRMAALKDFSDIVVKEAACRVGFYKMRTSAESTTRPEFNRAYKAVCDEISRDPKALVRLEQKNASATLRLDSPKEKKPKTKFDGLSREECMNKLKEMLG